MKKFLFTSLLVVLITTGFLVAQDNNWLKTEGRRLETGKTDGSSFFDITVNCEQLIANCNNSAESLNCYLMMNPSLEEGTKTLEEAFGVFGKDAVRVEVGSVGTKRGNVVTAIPSSNVLRLRGGGPKKSQPTGGLKSTGDSSDEDDNISNADSSASEDIQDMLNAEIDESIETTRRAHVASSLLEKQQQAKKGFKKQQALVSGKADDDTCSVGTVDSTWIQDTLYKTAQMKLGATLKKEQANLQSPQNPHSPTKEQELASKKKMTFLFHENSKLAVEKAQRAGTTAETRLKKEEKEHQKILADQQATPLDQENSSLNIIYQKALVTYATSDHEFKKAQRELAEVQLATVNAELMLQEAQHIESDLSSLNKAETAFELAREEEEKLEQKTDPIANEAAARNSWCEALKKAFEATVTTNDLREKTPSLSSTTNWNNILQEAQDTEHAWNEVVDTCNSALDNKPTRALKKAWEKDLEEAVNQHVLWQVRVLWWKTMKTAEETKISNIPQNTALQQAKEMDSVYDEIVETIRKKQNDAPARLKFWWTHDLQQIEIQHTAYKAEFTKLQEAKKLLHCSLETLNRELKFSQEQNKYLVVEIQQALISEMNQALAKIDQIMKQHLSNTSGVAEQTQTLLSQIDLLLQQDQCLKQYLTQLKDLEEVFLPLQNRAKALANEIASQKQGETSILQEQKILLEEMKNTLEQASQAIKQLLAEDETASAATSQRINELIPIFDQLRLRDEQLQGKVLSLHNLGQKKKEQETYRLKSASEESKKQRATELQEEAKQLQEQLAIGRKEGREKETLPLREQQTSLLGYLKKTAEAYTQWTADQLGSLNQEEKKIQCEILYCYERTIAKQKEAIAAQWKNRIDGDDLQEFVVDAYQKNAQAEECALEAMQEGSSEAVSAYQQAGTEYLQRAEALSEDDYKKAQASEEKAECHLAIGNALLAAKQEEKRGNHEAAGLCHQEAATYQEMMSEYSSSLEEKDWGKVHKKIDALESAAKNYCKGVKASRRAEKSRGAEASYIQQEIKSYQVAAEAWRESDEKKAMRLEKAAYSYHRAAQEQRDKNPKGATCWKEVAQSYQQKENDTNVFWKQGAAEYYKKSVQALSQGLDEIASLYQREAEGYEHWIDLSENQNADLDEKTYPSSSKKDKERLKDKRIVNNPKTVVIDRNVFSSQIAWSYRQALEQDNKGNVEAAIAWRKVAQSYEQQTAVIGDQRIKFYQKVALAYKRAAEQQSKNNLEISETYCKQAQAYEQQAEALIRGDKEVTDFQQNIVDDLILEQNEEEEEVDAVNSLWDPTEVEKIKSASEVESSAELEQSQKDMKEQLAHFIFIRNKRALQQAKEQEQFKNEDNKKAALCYRRESDVYQRGREKGRYAAEKMSLFSFYDEALAEQKAGENYEKAAHEEKQGHSKVASLYRETAEAYAAQAECYQAEDEMLIKREGTIASLLRRAAEATSRLPRLSLEKSNEKAQEGSWASYLEQAAETFKKGAAAAQRGQMEEAEQQETIGAYYWMKSLDAQARERQEKCGNHQAVQCYQNALQSRDLQIKAFQEKKENEVMLQNKIVELQQRAAWAYEQAAYQRLHNYPAAAERYQEQAQEYLQHVGQLREHGLEPIELEKMDFEKKLNTTWKEIEQERALASAARERQDNVIANMYEKKVSYLVWLAASCKKRAEASKGQKEDQQKLFDQGTAFYKEALKKCDEAISLLQKGNSEESKQIFSSSLAYEKAAKVLGLYHEDGYSWSFYQGGAAQAYEQATEQEAEGKKEVATAWRKVAQTYEKEAKVLLQGDEKQAEIQEQIAQALSDAAWKYSLASKEQKKGNAEVAETWRRSARAYEAQAVALEKGDEKQAEIQAKVAKILADCYYDGSYIDNTAAYAYNEASKKQKEGNIEAAKTWRRSARAYEAQAAALEKGDEKQAEIQERVAQSLYSADWYYSEASKEQKKGNAEVAETWRRSARAHEAQAAALEKGDEKQAEIQEWIVNVLSFTAWNYSEASEEQKIGNLEEAEAWRRSTKAREAQVAASEKGDEKQAEIQAKVAITLAGVNTHRSSESGGEFDRNAVYAYSRASYEQKKGNVEVAEAWRRSARAYEAQAAALAKDDEEQAEIRKQIADALFRAAQVYSEASEAQEKGNAEVAEDWRRSARDYEAQAAALRNEEEEKALIESVFGVTIDQ